MQALRGPEGAFRIWQAPKEDRTPEGKERLSQTQANPSLGLWQGWGVAIAGSSELPGLEGNGSEPLGETPGKNYDAHLFKDAKTRPNCRLKPKIWVSLSVFI